MLYLFYKDSEIVNIILEGSDLWPFGIHEKNKFYRGTFFLLFIIINFI